MIAFVVSVVCFIINFYINHPFCIWDEVVYSHNSISMSENHLWFSYYLFGKIDHYNSKPPLVIWLQVLSLKVFGINELAIRFPTFLALLGTLSLLLNFCKKFFKSYSSGLIACLILCTTIGVIRPHVFLTGDLDGVLVFFSTLIFLNVLKAILSNKFDNRFYYQTLVFFILGYFTKSTAILLIIPSLVLILFVSKNLNEILFSKHFYISIGAFICTISSYYLIREQLNPGHFEVVWNSEFLRLTKVVMTWHVQPFNFYFKNIFNLENKIYSIVSFLMLPVYFFMIRTNNKKMVGLLLLSVLTYIFFISFPSIKLEWYTAPIYPIWSLALGIMFSDLFIYLNEKNRLSFYSYTLLLILLFAFSSIKMIKNIKLKTTEIDYLEKEAMLLKTFNNKHKWKHYKVLMSDEAHDEVFYLYGKIIQQKENCRIDRIKSIKQIIISDTILVSKKEFVDTIQQKYFIKEIAAFDFGKVLKIDSLK